MDILQEGLNKTLKDVPGLILQNLISKKLQKQGITESKDLPRKLAKHILSRSEKPFRYRSRKLSGKIDLAFDQDDLNEIDRALERFQREQLPKLLPETAHRISKMMLKTLRASWPKEQALQQADLSGFRERLEERWGQPLGQLRMLLTMCREWCQWIHQRNVSLKGDPEKKQLQSLLIRLLTRGCQVTDEIICLLENGFADGAMARWRTLHEISVVAAVIRHYGNDIAAKYIDHQAVESKRKLDKYLVCYKDLGYKPLSARAQNKIVKTYNAAIARYGKPFKSDYGWAAFHLNNDWPTFADLEKAAGRAEMRSHYQMGNDNIHAGIKSMYFRLGLLNRDGLLAGRSNAGLMEPGQNTAHTLTQLAAIVGLSEPIMDDLVAADMMRMLRDAVPKSLHKAARKLLSDDKKYKE
jgi:hypothetical protein